MQGESECVARARVCGDTGCFTMITSGNFFPGQFLSMSGVFGQCEEGGRQCVYAALLRTMDT